MGFIEQIELKEINYDRKLLCSFLQLFLSLLLNHLIIRQVAHFRFPVFVLNGYEDLTLFKDLDEDELTYLGIHDGKDREKLIEMAELLFPDDNKNVSVDNEALHAEDENLNFYDCNSRRK